MAGLVSILSSLFVFLATSVATSPVVDLGYAQYEGHFDEQTGITSFLSVRYAAAPVGNLRFQAPRPPVPMSGIQPATQNSNICYQAGYGSSSVVPSYGRDKRQSVAPVVSEDCLFLNVFVPGEIPAEPIDRFPVLVWIHGGGYEGGYAAQTDGADLVSDSLNSIVVVTIQYRLGAFGFLSGNEVKSNGALNAGLLDQVFALQWVQEHIGAFGGDETDVTIWGESAGGGSVLQHVVANRGNTQPPLFTRAITSSVFLPPQYDYNGHVPQSLYDGIVSLVGCASSVDTFACLQSLRAETLQAANTIITNSSFYGTYPFVPVVDGTYIVERPTLTLARGQVNGQVLYSVTNQYEGNVFVNGAENSTTAQYISLLFPDMTPVAVRKAAAIYRGYGTPVEQAMLVMGDTHFVCPTYYLLQAFLGRSWKGLFAVPLAYHSRDLPYYFYSASSPPSYDVLTFITAFSQSFMSFVKYGDVDIKFDPSNITPEWPMYDVDRTEMLFNRTEKGVPVVKTINTGPGLVERCAFWSTMTDMTAQ